MITLDFNKHRALLIAICYFPAYVIDCDGEEYLWETPGYSRCLVMLHPHRFRRLREHTPAHQWGEAHTICKGHGWLVAIHRLQCYCLKMMEGSQLFYRCLGQILRKMRLSPRAGTMWMLAKETVFLTALSPARTRSTYWSWAHFHQISNIHYAIAKW